MSNLIVINDVGRTTAKTLAGWSAQQNGKAARNNVPLTLNANSPTYNTQELQRFGKCSSAQWFPQNQQIF